MKKSSLEIIVIEDEEDILELVEYHLQKAGYETMGFSSTQNIEQFLEEENPVLMIIDRNLPQVEGAEFVKKLRSYGYTIPVIFLTAKAKDSELEEGFEAGCDDYITKPFNPKELVFRVNALLKRSGILLNKKIKHRDITMNSSTKEVFVDNQLIELSHLEFKLLHTFIQKPNQVLDRDFLRDEVWREEENNFQDKSINVAINRLKKKIDATGEKEYFMPIRSVGYKLI
ncbi:MAG: response regulator transcription factor [Sulfurovaceae bacterium]|nr:response regulator transcription factor [Sulfurovaceae bacterium]